MTHPEIHHATTDDASTIAELIATAFHTLDATAWLIPDPDERARVLPAEFAIYVDHALTHGQIDLTEDVTGELAAVAVWFPQPTGPAPAPEDYDARLVAACGTYIDRFRTLDRLFDDNHPDVYPHHHLAYLATRPDQQGQGLGTALLRHHHERLDMHRIPAFLQASGKQSRTLYERHGYECLGDPFYLPDGPPFWAMWREFGGPEARNARQSSTVDSATE